MPWWVGPALLAGAAAWLQATALGAPFFADDYLFLQQVRHHSLFEALGSPDPIGNFARPVGRQLHFWWLAAVSGESPIAFHAANLIAFLGAVVLLYAIARRLAGPVAAAVAGAFLALTYAADVPVRWASGSQDLLALVGALGAMWLFLGGRRWWAALALLAGLLSKETVAFTPVVAVLAARRPGESWRASVTRAWPLAVSMITAGLVWLVLRVPRGAASATVQWTPAGPGAALVHLAQAALGAEWRRGGGLAAPPLVPLALVVAAVWLARRGPRGGVARPGEARAVGPVRVGMAWALLGALPVAAVAPIWSAYYYLFALCGVGLALGAWASRLPLPATLGLVALFGWGAEHGRRLDEFATRAGAWTAQSHVNRFYLDRAMDRVSRYLADMKRARPTLPASSTIFFNGLPAFLGFQTADGPLVRWAYRDSSLRSYYLYQFTGERFRRGPAFFFGTRNDSLVERPRGGNVFLEIAFNSLQNEQLDGADEAIRVALETDSTNLTQHYWAGWVALARGDSSGARRHLARARVQAAPGPTPEIDLALESVARGDTMAAVQLMASAIGRHGYDPEAHATLGDLLVNLPSNLTSATIEAFAARTLAPDVARNWWRWAYVQYMADRHSQALRTLERYLTMPGRDPRDEAQARSLLELMREAAPGGALVQQELRTHVGGTGGAR